LDDRSFQDLVDEAKKRIPLYCPEWTDHNVSDPGITLLELFAWMMDILLYRLNQVPHKHYVKLLELLGIQLEPPNAASVPLTFYLSAPQEQPVVIPQGTAASTSRAAGGEAIVFATDERLRILPARLGHIIVRQRADSRNLAYREIGLQRLQREFTPFSAELPQPGEALYFGFEEPLDHHYVGFDVECVRAGGLNIIPESPPLSWQAWTDKGWGDVDVEIDSTGGMSWSGQVRVHLPRMAPTEIGGISACWVRCQVVEPKPGQRPYTTSPIIRDVRAVTWGATVSATHATEVSAEMLGRSDGSPGQVFQLEHLPVLPRRDGERIELWQTGMAEWEPWLEVATFAECGAEDRCYTLDSVSGEITFGPALRQRDGTVRRYGAVPVRSADIRFARYRHGGGASGNVRAGAITELKTALAYVARISNRLPAQGGLDAEPLDHAIFRARNLLRTRYRAVTPADYEYLTLDGFRGRIARARCLQTTLAGAGGSPTPGQVYVIVIPLLHDEEARGYIPLSRLALSHELQREITALLDERRLLTTQLAVRAAGYKRVRVEADVVARPGADERRLGQDIVAALNAFVNPLSGGPDGTGWPFGRELYLSDLYACIQPVEGLLNVQTIEMFWVDEADRLYRGDRRIDLLAHEVVVSDIHQVRVTIE
jgi:predicted phage baseplate assembly protein